MIKSDWESAPRDDLKLGETLHLVQQFVLSLGCCETEHAPHWPHQTAAKQHGGARVDDEACIRQSVPIAFHQDTHHDDEQGFSLPQHPLRTQARPYPALLPLHPQQQRQSSGIFALERRRGGRTEGSRAPRGGQWERLVSLLPRLTKAARRVCGEWARARVLAAQKVTGVITVMVELMIYNRDGLKSNVTPGGGVIITGAASLMRITTFRFEPVTRT